MNGLPMEQFNNGDETALSQLMPLKMREIRRRSTNGRQIYCETNHSFIQGWGMLLPDVYIPQEEIAVIVLRRDTQKTADSLLRVHDVPGLSLWSRTWYLSPGAVRNISLPAVDANPYDLCRWCVDEINLRAEEYQRRFPRISYYECDLDQLNDYAFVLALFSQLGLTPDQKLKDAVGRTSNKKNEWPGLSRSELLSVSPYSGTESLLPEQRGNLVREMVSWLHSARRDAYLALQRDYASGGTLAPAVIALVAQAESELERAFRIALRFSEAERILIYELLHSIDSGDVAFSHVYRFPGADLHYAYEYNNIVNLPLLFRRLGWRSGLRTIWLLTLSRQVESRF